MGRPGPLVAFPVAVVVHLAQVIFLVLVVKGIQKLEHQVAGCFSVLVGPVVVLQGHIVLAAKRI